MSAPPGGRHRAPEPAPPAGPSPVFAFWVLLLLVTGLVSFILGLATGSVAAWTVCTGAVMFGGWTWLVTRTPTPHPRARREAAYVGRTAERATVWWVVFRALNGIFR